MTTSQSGPSEPLYFVLCPSFHGATLFALLLNNHQDIVTLGDTNPTRAYDQICACGEHVSACPFWQAVADECRTSRFAGGAKMLPTLPRLIKHDKLNKLNRAINLGVAVAAVRLTPKLWRIAPKPVDEFVDTWNTFRQLACRRGHARLAVDGEKSIAKFLALTSAGDRETRILHLTRDPRAFVNSCRRHHSQDWRSAVAEWKRTHERILMVSRLLGNGSYLRVPYDELARDPRPMMRRVFDFLGVADADVCHTPRNPEKHHLMGNKMLRNFDGQIRYDTAWKTALPRAEQDQILRSCEALCARLGYPDDE